MKSPRLTFDENGRLDLLLQNGKFAWAEQGTQAAQHAITRLLIFKGELSLNGILTEKTLDGTQWYEVIFATSASMAEKTFEIQKRILGVPEIDHFLEFQWLLENHTLKIVGSVKTQWGAESVSAEVTPL